MHILVTGSAGFVGRHVAHHLSTHGHRVVAAYHQNEPCVDGTNARQLDITKQGAVRTLIEHTEPEAIVHAAAISDADKCEQHPEEAKEVNVRGTETIARNARETGSSLLFVSSSFVFSGDANKYTEDDPRDPINVYGETKAAAERIVEEIDVPSTTIRIDQPYGWSTDWQSDSMIEWVLNKLGSQTTPVEVFKDWSNNPIHNSDVANCIRLLLEDEHRGIYHVVGPEFINRYSWARQIAVVFGYDPNRISPSESGDALPADRPNASLSTKKITSTLNYCPVGIHDGLYRMIREHQNKCEFSSGQS